MDRKTASLPVLCYHGVSDGFDSPWVLAENEFENQILELVRSGFGFCSLDEIISGRIDESKKYCAITFDDGRIVSESSLRLMDKYQISATFFIVINFIDGIRVPKKEQYCPFFSWEQIKGLISKNHTIGSHTVSHPRLHKLGPKEILFEMMESKKILEDKLKSECRHFALPYGDGDDALLACALSCQYESMSNIELKLNSLPFSGNTISRISVLSGKGLHPQVFQKI